MAKCLEKQQLLALDANSCTPGAHAMAGMSPATLGQNVNEGGSSDLLEVLSHQIALHASETSNPIPDSNAGVDSRENDTLQRANRGTTSCSTSVASHPGAFSVENPLAGSSTSLDISLTPQEEEQLGIHASIEPTLQDAEDNAIERPVLAFKNSITATLVDEDEDLQDENQKLREKLEKLENAPTATVVSSKDAKTSQKHKSVLLCLVLAVILAIVLGVLGATGIFTKRNTEGNLTDVVLPAIPSSNDTTILSNVTVDQSALVSALPNSTLEAVRERGVIRCRLSPAEYTAGNGTSLQLCRAMSAAIFGDPNRTEFLLYPIQEFWPALDRGEIDIATSRNTPYMGRDCFEKFSRKGKSFSTPYFFSGVLAAGPQNLVDCIDRQDTLTGVCKDMTICALEGASSATFAVAQLDGAQFLFVQHSDDLFKNLASGACNIVVGADFFLSQENAWDAGYTGEFVYASNVFSVEPTVMTTRENDPQWTDFTNSVLQALITAEFEGITNENATLFPETDFFGDNYRHMYQHAIAAAGNWKQVYEDTFGRTIPRQPFNFVNRNIDSGGLMYAPPLLELDWEEQFQDGETPHTSEGDALEYIEKRASLKCGIIPDRPGFAIEGILSNTTVASFTGMDVDLCHCLASALFGDPTLVEFVVMEDEVAAFASLASNMIDVAAGIAYKLEKDIQEPTTGKGYSFSPIYFYGKEGEKIGLVTNQDATQWTDFVRWTIYGLIQAEMDGLGKQDASKMPTTDLFGPSYKLMFQLTLLNHGSFADLYEKNLQDIIPRQGANLLKDGSTPLLYPLAIEEFRGRW